MIKSRFLDEIQLASKEMPCLEKKVARYILAHPQDVLQMTVNELSTKSESSRTAVSRFCKSVGIRGFSHLKARLSVELNQEETADCADNKARELIVNPIACIIKKTLYRMPKAGAKCNPIEKSIQT